jgi:hypothetical protein
LKEIFGDVEVGLLWMLIRILAKIPPQYQQGS